MSETYYCNPLNIHYRYQFNRNPVTKTININREAADPSLIYFKGQYYMFVSMTLDVLVSTDLVHWENKPLPKSLPLYGYAPDARVYGDFVYFCANESKGNCHFYRTKNILDGPYEKIEGMFHFDDPSLFVDDDGRFYFYWGLSAKTPIYGVELDPETLHPLGEPKSLIFADAFTRGFERTGEDNALMPCTDDEVEQRFKGVLAAKGISDVHMVPPEMVEMMKDVLRNAPYIEGAWMSKLNGKYYLQYAAPGTQFNTYCDSVYVSDKPLGPFLPAENNPYSYKPGGFFPGAGHGSTMEDPAGGLWHASTMRISVNHQFERRVGLWPAGLDKDGELFCNQRYGDWPICREKAQTDPWAEPDWMLQSYGRTVTASSFVAGHGPELAVDENVRTWWQASGCGPGEWLELDLGNICNTFAIQINFADDNIAVENPESRLDEGKERYIETAFMPTRWKLESSIDHNNYFIIADKSEAGTDLSHDFIVNENGFLARYIRLTILTVPYGQKPCISGLRVFGKAGGALPDVPEYEAIRTTDLDMTVSVKAGNAMGHTILWGYSPDKLYHSYQTFEPVKRIGALVRGQDVYVRVDGFNENGITHGNVVHLMEQELP